MTRYQWWVIIIRLRAVLEVFMGPWVLFSDKEHSKVIFLTIRLLELTYLKIVFKNYSASRTKGLSGPDSAHGQPTSAIERY